MHCPQPQLFATPLPGTPPVLPLAPVISAAPVPAAFRTRGIPPGGFPTAAVNAQRSSSSLVTWNASNSQWSCPCPYEVLNIPPPISCPGISGDNINLIEVQVLPSEVWIQIYHIFLQTKPKAEVCLSMVEAQEFLALRNNICPEFYCTRVLHRIQAGRLHERLWAFQCILQFSNMPLSMWIHDLLAQVQLELVGRGFHFHNPYDPGNPSFTLLQIQSGGTVLTTFGLNSPHLSDYYPTPNETLENRIYEVNGFRTPGWFSREMNGTHVLQIGR